MNEEYNFSIGNLLLGFFVVSVFILGIAILADGMKDLLIDTPAEIKACDSFCVSDGGFSTGIRTIGARNEIPLCDCAIGDKIITYRNVDGKFYMENG